jgi:hypothetical protein
MDNVKKMPNNRFDLSNTLVRNLQEQQYKLRAKPFWHRFAGLVNVKRTFRVIRLIQIFS